MSPFVLFVKQGYCKIRNAKKVSQKLPLFLPLVVNLGLCSYSFFSFFVVTKLGLHFLFLFLFLMIHLPLILPFVDRCFSVQSGCRLIHTARKNPF